MYKDQETTTPMRPAAELTRPVFDIPPLSCDCHFHVFEPGYPSIPKPFYTFPEGATIDACLAMQAALGIERMVLVAPSYYGNDNRLTLDFLRRIGANARAVVRLEDDVTDAELDDYDKLGVRAIRIDLFGRADWALADIVAYIEKMAGRARPRGWHVQLFSPGKILRELLPFLADFEDDFALDHMGYMREADGLTSADFEALLAVFKQGKCWIKLSGADRIAGTEPLSTVAPMARAFIAARPDRLIWGSDWPHLPRADTDTGALLNLLADWAPDAAVRRMILAESPAKLFFGD
jgi:predicted TIM-barrel fold metal-dependent hydrolase